MATKSTKATEPNATNREETTDAPLIDSMGAAVKKLLQRGKERGFVTYDELNSALPPEEVSSEQIEDTMTTLSELGINVVENEESEEAATEDAKPEAGTALTTTSDDDQDLGRTDDPVRMYLREMGSVELLSREGEIAIAKRIEAGRERMIGAICESPLTLRALLTWRDALVEGVILLRDVIDLDATYDGDPNTAAVRQPIPTPRLCPPPTAIPTPRLCPPPTARPVPRLRSISTNRLLQRQTAPPPATARRASHRVPGTVPRAPARIAPTAMPTATARKRICHSRRWKKA